ncbi:hypothetical protein lerEdw1_012532 [Lerista edwardsae]|nr:hypothetical protein lerEdw1_012532 [Lerista edwardsae]
MLSRDVRVTSTALLVIQRWRKEVAAGDCAKMNTRGFGSQLKDSIPVTDFSAGGSFESYDLLHKGFTNVKSELFPVHPLELSEKNFSLSQDQMNFSTLRNIQGLHAPMKLQMEFKAVKQVQRLPFLHSSNLSLDILKGNYDCIGFEDILNGLDETYSSSNLKRSS